MDEVVAMSTALRASHCTPTTPSAAVDNIPFLIRALSQIHTDSTRLLTSRTTTPSTSTSPPTTSASNTTSAPTAVHAPAIRLFASLGFEVDRLRRAIAALDATPPFVDTPLRPIPPFRHPSWLAPRALDDARLTLNASLRDASAAALRADLDAARNALVDSLSKLYPVDAPTLLKGSRTRLSGTSAPLTPMSAAAFTGVTVSGVETTPGSATARRPRTPGTSAPGSGGRNSVQTPAVAALPLPEGYLSTASAVATRREALSVATLMHEAAVASEDSPHFIYMLDILARTARCTTPVAPVASDDAGSNVVSTTPSEDVFVWASRTALEQQFAMRIPGLPEQPHRAAPQSVIPPIERFVADTFAQSEQLQTSARPSIWPCVYYCLRVGALSAATHLLQRTSSVPAEFFEWFEGGRKIIRRAFRDMHRGNVQGGAHGGGDLMQDDVNVMDDSDNDVPFVAGCLTTEQMYEAVAAEYRSASLSSDDPYMRACYVLLMRLDLSTPASVASSENTSGGVHGLSRKGMTAGGKHERFSLYLSDEDFELVFPSVEDYLWLRLWLCRTSSERGVMAALPNSSFLTLGAIQAEIVSCGEAHFDPDGSQPLLYAFVLAASIQFERAVMYLYDHEDEHWLHYAVHLAMVLYHKGWASADKWYERMVARYVEQVSKRNVLDAVVYILTMRSVKEVREQLVELVERSGEYDVLLGHAGKEDGAIAAMVVAEGRETVSKFGAEELAKVRREAGGIGAAQAVRRGELSRAGELLEIAGRWVDAMEMRMRDAAGEVHKLWSGRRTSAMLAARGALQRVQAGSFDGEDDGSGGVVARLEKGLQLLLEMGAAFEDYWTGRYAAAWGRLRDVELIPMKTAELSGAQRLVAEVSRWWKVGGEAAVASTDGNGGKAVCECVVELVKVVLHIAEYALESKSLAVAEEERQWEQGMGMHGLQGSQAEGLPAVDEIKAVAVFAAMLRRMDATMDQRLVHIESLLLSVTSK